MITFWFLKLYCFLFSKSKSDIDHNYGLYCWLQLMEDKEKKNSRPWSHLLSPSQVIDKSSRSVHSISSTFCALNVRSYVSPLLLRIIICAMKVYDLNICLLLLSIIYFFSIQYNSCGRSIKRKRRLKCWDQLKKKEGWNVETTLLY